MSQSEAEENKNRVRIRCRFCYKLNSVWQNDLDPAGEATKCRKCWLPLSEAPHKKWASVDPDCYIHPLDRQALQALRQIPGVDSILKKLLEVFSERMIRVACNATSIKVSRSQCPDLDHKLEVVCNTLGMEKPDLYVSLTDDFGGLGVNAMTTGVEKPFIIVYSSLVERLDEAEILAVLAHEMGHIHCKHVLYRTAAMVLLKLLYSGAGTVLKSTPIVGILGLLSIPIQIALITWAQKAELSCDRAGLLVVQDERIVMNALMKLAGGSLRESRLNLDAFIEQARTFDKNYEDDFLDKFYTLILASGSSHPFPVWRISEMLKWTEDESPTGYRNLMKSGDSLSFRDLKS